MIKQKSRIGFLAGMLMSAGCMTVYAAGAWAGWVVSAETESSGGKPAGTSKPDTGKPETTKSPMTMKFQDKKLRVDASGYSFISDGVSGDQIMLMHEPKKYRKMSSEELKALMEQGRKMMGENASKEPVKPEATGKKEKIGEFNTEEYAATLPNGQKMSFWTTTDSDAAEKLRDQMVDAVSKLATLQGQVDYKSIPGFPIRTVVDMPARKMNLPNGMTIDVPGSKTVNTVTSIKEEGLDAGIFEIPAGYTELEMPKMGPGGPTGGASKARPMTSPAKTNKP